MNNNIPFGTNTHKKYGRVRRMSWLGCAEWKRAARIARLCRTRAKRALTRSIHFGLSAGEKGTNIISCSWMPAFSVLLYGEPVNGERTSAHTHAIVRKTLFRVKIVINFFLSLTYFLPTLFALYQLPNCFFFDSRLLERERTNTQPKWQ